MIPEGKTCLCANGQSDAARGAKPQTALRGAKAAQRRGRNRPGCESASEDVARQVFVLAERLLDEVSFDATRLGGQTVRIDAAYVDARLQSLSQDEDLSRYIL